MARPVRQMQRALTHWPGPAGHHPGDPAALKVPCPRRREGAWEDLAQLHGMSGQARPGISRWPHCACLLPLERHLELCQQARLDHLGGTP
jgi:hypothetical protein